MADYILVTETGSDIHEETARRHGIVVVPMHVNFGEVSRDDDSFPARGALRVLQDHGQAAADLGLHTCGLLRSI